MCVCAGVMCRFVKFIFNLQYLSIRDLKINSNFLKYFHHFTQHSANGVASYTFMLKHEFARKKHYLTHISHVRIIRKISAYIHACLDTHHRMLRIKKNGWRVQI